MRISVSSVKTILAGVVFFVLGNDAAIAAGSRLIAVDDTVVVAPGGMATDTNNGQTFLVDNDLLPSTGIPAVNLKTAAAKGSAVINPDGTFSYKNTDQTATHDSFLYRVCVGITCDTATVHVTISAANPLPTIMVPFAVGDGGAVRTAGQFSAANGEQRLLDNDFNPSGSGDLLLRVSPSMLPAHGTLSWSTAGDFTYTHDGSPGTSDTFYYEACEQQLTACSLGKVTVTIITGSGRVPRLDRIAVAGDGVVVQKGQSTTTANGNKPRLTTNDADPFGGSLTTRMLGRGPSRGMANVNEDGSFKYTNTSVFYYRTALPTRLAIPFMGYATGQK